METKCTGYVIFRSTPDHVTLKIIIIHLVIINYANILSLSAPLIIVAVQRSL